MKTPALKLEYDGASYISRRINDIMAEISNLEVGDVVTVTKIEISDDELNALPEFSGF